MNIDLLNQLVLVVWYINLQGCEAVMDRQSDTYIIFRDIQEIVLEFKDARTPKKVRRLFTELLVKLKQLTEFMRREYKNITGEKWSTEGFNKWDDVSHFFYLLRNMDLHEALTRISIREEAVFTILIGESEKDFKVSSTALLTDQFNDEVPSPGLKIALDEKRTKVIQPHTFTYSFELETTYSEVETLVHGLQERDLHNLVEHYFKTITAYYDYYQDKLKENKRIVEQ